MPDVYRVSIPQADVHGIRVIANSTLGAVEGTVNGGLKSVMPDRWDALRNLEGDFSVLVYRDTTPLHPQVFVVAQVTVFEICEAKGY